MRSRSLLVLGAGSLLALGATMFACGDDSVTSTDGGTTPDGSVTNTVDGSLVAVDGSVPTDSGNADTGTVDAGVNRGPAKLLLPNMALAAPNGLF